MSAGPSSGSPGYRKSGSGPGGVSGSRLFGDAPQSGAPAFTAEMRDRQARGMDPYSRSGEASDDAAEMTGGGSGAGTGTGSGASIASEMKMRLGGPEPETEPWSRLERTTLAAAILDSPEMLMMYAQSSGDSIPATRLRFMRTMCGFSEDGDEDGSGGGGGGGGGDSRGGSRPPPMSGRGVRDGGAGRRSRGGDRAASSGI